MAYSSKVPAYYKDVTIATYDAIAEDYAAKVDGLHPNEFANQFYLKLKPNGSILDLGCAAGRDCKVFTNKGYQVTGVDLSKKTP